MLLFVAVYISVVYIKDFNRSGNYLFFIGVIEHSCYNISLIALSEEPRQVWLHHNRLVGYSLSIITCGFKSCCPSKGLECPWAVSIWHSKANIYIALRIADKVGFEESLQDFAHPIVISPRIFHISIIGIITRKIWCAGWFRRYILHFLFSHSIGKSHFCTTPYANITHWRLEAVHNPILRQYISKFKYRPQKIWST